MNYSEYLPYATALLIATPFLVYARQFVFKFIELKEKELKLMGLKAVDSNRLQAYEKMTIFLERLKPSNLINRFDRTLKPHEFLFLIEKSVTEEFEYNTPQQIYMSKNLWQNISGSKNEILQQIKKVYESLNSNANLDDFKTLILMNYMNSEDVIGQTMDELKREAMMITNKK